MVLGGVNEAKRDLQDQYTLDESGVLGEGAYGMVYKCQHRITEIDYAVKIIDKRLGARRQKVISNRDYSFQF